MCYLLRAIGGEIIVVRGNTIPESVLLSRIKRNKVPKLEKEGESDDSDDIQTYKSQMLFLHWTSIDPTTSLSDIIIRYSSTHHEKGGCAEQ